jgi:hypothetical protein
LFRQYLPSLNKFKILWSCWMLWWDAKVYMLDMHARQILVEQIERAGFHVISTVFCNPFRD